MDKQPLYTLKVTYKFESGLEQWTYHGVIGVKFLDKMLIAYYDDGFPVYSITLETINLSRLQLEIEE